MKIIHTSDWHLGHVHYGHDRSDEFIHFFDEFEKIVAEESPDALLVSGDIFDISMPSSAVSRMFKDRVLRIRALAPDMRIIVTAGNHDSASRIDVDRNLWKVGGIHVLGSVARQDGVYDFSENIVEIGGKGYVVAVPFVNGVFLPRICDDESPEESFFKKAAVQADAVASGKPVVLMAHLSVAGCDRTGHRDPQIGGIDSVGDDIFPEKFDYVALGHIHRRQSFKGGRIAYSGSPLPIGFDECYPHSINVVEVESGAAPRIRSVEIMPLRKFITIPEEGADFKSVLRQLSKIPDTDDIYVRPYVRQDSDLPSDAMELALSKTKGKRCRVCPFKYEKTNTNPEIGVMAGISASDFVEASPVDLAGRYFSAIGLPEEECREYLEMLSGLCREIGETESL